MAVRKHPGERENLAVALEGSPLSEIFQRGKCEFPLLGERVRVRANPFSAAWFRLRVDTLQSRATQLRQRGLLIPTQALTEPGSVNRWVEHGTRLRPLPARHA